MKRTRTPTMIQMETVECGAVALGIILAYFGKFVSLEQLRENCGITRDGSLVSNILRAARGYGLEARGVKCDFSELLSLKTPFIVSWTINQFLVVEGFGKNKVYLNDPASGPTTLSFEEFKRGYTGLVILLEQGPSFKKSGKPKGLVRMLLPYFSSCEIPLLYLFLAGIFLLIPGIALPTLTQFFVDEILVQSLSSTALFFLVIMILSLIVTGILTALQGYFLNRLNGKLSIRLSSQFLWHILRLPVEFYTHRYGGEIGYRLDTADTIVRTITGQFVRVAINLILVFVYGVIMMFYDITVALIGIGFALLNLLVMLMINRSRIDAGSRLRQDLGKTIEVSIGTLQNIETIKAMDSENDSFSRWSGYFTKTLNSNQEIAKFDVILTALPPFTQLLTTATVLTVGGLHVIQGDLTIGQLLALQTLMSTFLLPIIQFVSLGQNAQNLKGDLIRLDDVLHNSIDPQLQLYQEAKDGESKLKGELELKNITFGYNHLASPLLENFNLHVKPGQSIALIGPTGAGKTTVVKLLSGLYQPWSGEILFDNKKFSEISRSLLNRSLGVVDEQIFFFGGSIRDNLTLWDETIPEEDLLKACADAALHEDIMEKERGYDGQMLEGGLNFSAGQRQKIELARALLINPSFLILDDATHSLDAETEEHIMTKIKHRGCSTLIISPRLHTLINCDEIIYLQEGKILLRGTHDELIKKEDTYRKLVELGGRNL